jgi:hypothetical protein
MKLKTEVLESMHKQIYQIKRHGEGQRKEIYCMAQIMPWEEAE